MSMLELKNTNMNSVLTGVARIIDIAGVFDNNTKKLPDYFIDNMKLRSDMWAVGEDLENAIITFASSPGEKD